MRAPFELRLDSHCRHVPEALPWADVAGYTHALWRGGDGLLGRPPDPGEELELEAGSPFNATLDVPFDTLWLPPLVAVNGFGPDDGARLAELRVVRAVWRDPLAVRRHVEDGRPAATLRVMIEAVVDPFEEARRTAPRGGSVDLWSILGGHARHEVLAHGERTLAMTSFEGDVSFDYLLHSSAGWLALLIDESLCRGFFYAGRADLEPGLYEALRGPRQ